MKKINVKILISLFIFINFIFIANVNAASLNSGTYRVFMDSSRFQGASCPNNLSFLNISRSADGSYIATVKPGTTGSHNEELKCRYTYDRSTGKRDGSITYQFTINADTMANVGDYTVTLDLYQGYANEVNLLSDSGSATVNKFSISSGSDYISTECSEGSTACKVKIKDGLEYSAEIKEAKVVLNYFSSSASGEINATIRIHTGGKIRANAGNYGKCNFSNDWTINGNNYEYKYIGGNIILPDCDVSNSKDRLLEFKGWTRNYDLTNTENNCNEPIIRPGESFTPEVGATYSTCYVTASGIRLTINERFLALDSSSYDFNDNGIYTIKRSGNITLPTPKVKTGYKFLGWSKSGSSALTDAGTAVESDGSLYTAQFENIDEEQQNYQENKTLVVGYNSVWKIEGVTFTSNCSTSDSSKVGVETQASGSCLLKPLKPTSGSETVTIMAKSGDVTYQIKTQVVCPARVSESDGTDDIDETENNTECSLQAGHWVEETVEINEDEIWQPETGVFNFNVPTFNDILDNKLRDDDDTDEDTQDDTIKAKFSSSTEECKKFTVTSYSNEKTPAFRKDGVSLNVVYKATSKCDSSDVYPAMCMDPGRKGTGMKDIAYIKQRNLKENNAFDQGILNILGKLNNTDDVDLTAADDNTRIAANVAIRIWAMLHGEKGGYNKNSTTLTKHYRAYETLAEYYKNHNKSIEDNKWESDDDSKAIKRKVQKFLDAAEKKETTVIKRTIKNTITKTGTEDGDILIWGTIELPEGAVFSGKQLKVVCSSKVSCNTHIFTETSNSKKIDYKVRLKIKESAKNPNASLNIYYKAKSGYVAPDAALMLRRQAADDMQRMIIFNPGDVTLNIPLYGEGKKCDPEIQVCDNTVKKCVCPDGNPNCDCEKEICNEAVACLSGDTDTCTKTQKSIIKENNCCNYITNESSEAYKDYCSKNCVLNTYQAVCDVAANESRDSYKIYEATKRTTQTPNYSRCIVDVQNDISKGQTNNTPNFKDLNGNKYYDPDYDANPYCRVSCKEDWDLSMAGFKNFVGTSSVLAGSYFQINEDVYLSGKRTCVTTYVNYEQYLNNIQNMSNELMDAYNDYAERAAVYYALEEESHEPEKNWYKNPESNHPKTWWYYDDVVPHSGAGSSSVAAICGKTEETLGPVTGDSDVNLCDGQAPYISCTPSYSTEPVYCPTEQEITDEEGNTKTITVSEECGEVHISTATKVTAKSCYTWSAKHEFSCNMFRIKSTSAIKYDYYEKSGTKHDYNASTEHKELNANPSKTDSVSHPGNNVPSSPSDSCVVGNCSLTAPQNGDCDSDTNHDGTQDKEDEYYYKNFLLEKAVFTSHKSGEQKLGASVTKYANKVNNLLKKIKKEADYFGKCQNFYINDEKDVRGNTYRISNGSIPNYTGSNKYKINQNGRAGLTSESLTPQNIKSAYSPRSAYIYDEEGYMTVLGKDAVLEYNKDYNDGTAGDGKEADVSSNTCVTASGNNICNNKYNKTAYKSETPWSNGSDSYVQTVNSDSGYSSISDSTFELCQVNKTSGGRYYTDNTSAACSDAIFYYYDLNYFEHTVQNSGYFSNKDFWYVNMKTDVKAHTESKAKAASDYKTDKNDWSKIGTNHNVFPIEVTTRRNIYQYAYGFNDIGVYNDGSVGRILSTDGNALYMGKHVCFYEVKEELCLCCGDPIETTVVEKEMDKKIEEYSELNSVNYNKSDRNVKSNQGTIGYYVSTISLNSVKEESGVITVNGRALAANWQKESKFFNGTSEYKNNRGHKIMKNIEERGETIYDDNPEYSYTLDPSALAQLRNDKSMYGINSTKLKTVGVYNIDTTKNDTEKFPVLGHFINLTLQNDFKHWVTEDYKDVVLTARTGSDSDIVCVTQAIEGDNTSGSAKDAYNQIHSTGAKCRFVDYQTLIDKTHSRLAFK